MAFIIWTHAWSATDEGTILYATDIEDIQNDITGIINGNITDSNIVLRLLYRKVRYYLTLLLAILMMVQIQRRLVYMTFWK